MNSKTIFLIRNKWILPNNKQSRIYQYRKATKLTIIKIIIEQIKAKNSHKLWKNQKMSLYKR